MTKIIVGTNGRSAWPHFGGSIWVCLQQVLGLERLGLEPYWVDRLGPPDPCKDPHSVDDLVDRFRRTAEDFGFADRWCIVFDDGRRHFGMDERTLESLIDDTQLLINISGHLPPGWALERVPRRAYVDVDPGFTQSWAHQVDLGLARHNFFFTIGQNVDGTDFPIDLRGVAWQATLPPVVLDAWPACSDGRCSRISTVADWWGSQSAFYEGEWYGGGKREEFLDFLRVPVEAERQFEVALLMSQEDYEDLGILLRHGWHVLDPYVYAGDPHSYREFIQRSRAEFAVAKRGYVRTRSGWVSDRTACYLASGKPCVVQSTGFTHRLPVGEGLFAFDTVQQAVDAVRSVDADYDRHAAAARRMAEEHFDSRVVLGSMLESVGLQIHIVGGRLVTSTGLAFENGYAAAAVSGLGERTRDAAQANRRPANTRS